MFNIVFYIFFLFYEEILNKIINGVKLGFSAYLFIIFLGFLFGIISNLIPKKINKYIFNIFNFLLCFYYGGAIIVNKTFGIIISFDSLSMYKQFTSGGFINTTISVLFDNTWLIVFILFPFICGLYLTKKLDNKFTYKNILCLIITYLLFVVSLNDNTFSLYYDVQNNNQNVNNFGIVPSFVIEISKKVLGFKEKVTIVTNSDDRDSENILPLRQVDDVDLNFETDNDVVNEMNEYFKSLLGSYKNAYTGYFKGKNLIYIMAESFDGYFVSKELTPTLYKLINEGFYFENYYSPTNLSTIGGEFSLLTGLLPDLGTLNCEWIQNNNGHINYFPYGLAALFKNEGYNTYAYHDHEYDFQSRDKYLASLGFENYKACYNGLEEKIACNIFPESDLEMIEASIDDYINDDNFMVYYATVSGHGMWGFGYNDMAEKNKDLVKDLNYSDTVKAYIAANLELEKALSFLVEKLEEKDILDDTVIVLASDHHPYFMDDKYVEEMAGKELDQFSLYKNNLIIYNANVEYTKIDKVCNTIDVLPTVLNLFGLTYDSRLMAGRDIFSNSEGIVIFADYSWLTNKGCYSYNSGVFISDMNDNKKEDYIKRINNIVSNRYIMSRNILIYDYYRLIYK